MHATIPKGIVGMDSLPLFDRNLHCIHVFHSKFALHTCFSSSIALKHCELISMGQWKPSSSHSTLRHTHLSYFNTQTGLAFAKLFSQL